MTGITSASHKGRLRNFRLSAEQDARLEEIAADEGRTVSSLIRRTLERALFLPIDGNNSPVKGTERAQPANVTGSAAAGLRNDRGE